MNHYEAWREALIAFYEVDAPYMMQKLSDLRLGRPMNDVDRRTIDGIIAAQAVMKQAA